MHAMIYLLVQIEGILRDTRSFAFTRQRFLFKQWERNLGVQNDSSTIWRYGNDWLDCDTAYNVRRYVPSCSDGMLRP